MARELSFSDLARINRIRNLTERKSRGITPGMTAPAEARAAAEQIEDLPSPQDINVVLQENVQRRRAGGRGYTGRYAQEAGMTPFEELTQSISQAQAPEVEYSPPIGGPGGEGGGGDAAGYGGPATQTGTFGAPALQSALTGTAKTGLTSLGLPAAQAVSQFGTAALSPVAKALASFGIPTFGFSALNNLIGAAMSESAAADTTASAATTEGLTPAETARLSKAVRSSMTQRTALGNLAGVFGFGDTAAESAAAASAESLGAPAGIGTRGSTGSFGPPDARTGLQGFIGDLPSMPAQSDIAAEIPLGTTKTGFYGIIGEAEAGHKGYGKIGDVLGYGDLATVGLQGHRGEFGTLGEGGGGSSGSSSTAGGGETAGFGGRSNPGSISGPPGTATGSSTSSTGESPGPSFGGGQEGGGGGDGGDSGGGGSGGSGAGSASCFVAGTKVLMGDGSEKNIEDVEIGDWVMGSDNSLNKVIAYDRPKLGNRKLYGFNGSKPFVTAEHPFMTSRGWRSIDPDATAKENKRLHVEPLEAGDTMVREGISTILELIEARQSDPEQTVYNFVLSGNNTYYADGYLVHNKGGPGGCFAAGTMIMMVDYSLKPIEKIEVGDIVMSFNEKDGHAELEPNRVINTKIHQDEPVLLLNGKTVVTPVHRFYTSDNRLERIGYLNGGMLINEEHRPIPCILEDIQEYRTVYNFTVENNHTYIADGYRVHNWKEKGGLITDNDPTTSGGPVWQWYHEDEYVLPKGITSQIGVDALEDLRRGRVSAEDVGRYIRRKARK